VWSVLCVECGGVWSVVVCGVWTGVKCGVWCGVGLRILCQHNYFEHNQLLSNDGIMLAYGIFLKKGCGEVVYHMSTARICQWH